MIDKGFSLVELMLVLFIISVFAVFTFPSYQQLLIKTRRVDGQTALLELAQRLEDYYSQHHTYQGATVATGAATDILSRKYSEQNWYLLTITAQTDSQFNLQAIPIVAQANDLLCQTLTFNNVGIKGITAGPRGVPTGSVNQCW